MRARETMTFAGICVALALSIAALAQDAPPLDAPGHPGVLVCPEPPPCPPCPEAPAPPVEVEELRQLIEASKAQVAE